MLAAAFIFACPAGAQPTELVTRIQGADGSVTVTARGDARVTVAALWLMPLEAVAGDFALASLREWGKLIAAADSGSGDGDERSVVSLDGDVMLSLTVAGPPIIRLRRVSDGAVITLLFAPAARDSFARGVERAVMRTAEMTTAYAPILLTYTPRELLRGPAPRDTVKPDTSGRRRPYRAVERMYITAAAGLVGGAITGMMSESAGACLGGSPCPWSEGNVGFVAGTIVGTVLGGRLNSRSACPVDRRTLVAFEAAFAGAFPGGVVAAAGQRKGIFFIPVGQALTMWWLERECAKAGSGR